MDGATASILISGVALLISVLAVLYTRRQANAAESQLAYTRDADTERRLQAGLSVDIRGKDPGHLVATVKSSHPDPIAELTVTLLPVSDEPQMGFWADDDQRLVSSWSIYVLAPGAEATHQMGDLRERHTRSIGVRLVVLVDGRPYAWTATIAYPPRVFVL